MSSDFNFALSGLEFDIHGRVYIASISLGAKQIASTHRVVVMVEPHFHGERASHNESNYICFFA